MGNAEYMMKKGIGIVILIVYGKQMNNAVQISLSRMHCCYTSMVELTDQMKLVITLRSAHISCIKSRNEEAEHGPPPGSCQYNNFEVKEKQLHFVFDYVATGRKLWRKADHVRIYRKLSHDFQAPLLRFDGGHETSLSRLTVVRLHESRKDFAESSHTWFRLASIKK